MMNDHKFIVIHETSPEYQNQNIFEDVDITEWPFGTGIISPIMQEDTLEDRSSLQLMPSVLLQPPPTPNDVQPHFGPISPRGPPSKKSFPGDLNFIVEINAQKTNKKTYLYSHKLNRIYVNMDTNFSVQFNWDHTKAPQQMYVRATVVFWDESQAEKRVERCIQHRHTSNMSDVIVNNVLHSSRELGTQGVYYCGEPSLADSWYSVLVMFNKTTGESCSHAYKFGCKNSCNSGINRRAIGIVFTLEDFSGVVLGRQSVGVRVCACTRRDLLRDESQELPVNTDKLKKRPVQSTEEPTLVKKIKLDVVVDSDQEVCVLPPLPVVRLDTLKAGLEMMRYMMQQMSDLNKKNSHSDVVLDDCIEKMSNAIEEVNTKLNKKEES